MCGVFLLLLFLFLASFLVACPLKCLRIERHLAAKTGTNSAVSELMGSFFQTISS